MLFRSFSLRSNGTNGYDVIELRFNNSSGTYNMKRIYGNGASAVSETNSLNRSNIGYSDDNVNTASIFSSGRVYIPNYTSSINKTFSSDNVLENNSSTAIPFIGSGTWVDTSVINQITIFPEYGTLYNQYSTASLYGIKNS